MAGGKFSLANLFGVTIRESANDGSDFTNPDADYRRLFLGEDGLLHVKDSAGAVTSPYASSGVSSGTSNPGGPSNGDLFYRSDLDLLIRYRSSGTRWVCTCPHVTPISIQAALLPMSATSSIYAPLDSLTSDIYVDRVTGATIIPSGTSNATNYWTIAAGSFGSFDTKTDGNASTRHDLTGSPGLVTVASAFWFELTVTKTLSPGAVYVFMTLFYRYVVA